jgi:hypothetical protein
MLSNRFIDPNSAPSWNSTPNSFRTSYRSCSRSRGTSLPSIQIDPRSGRSRPTSVLRNTDFPVPDGPSITEISPAGSVSVTSCQITWGPKDFVSPSTWISTPTCSTPRCLDRRPPVGTNNVAPARRLRASCAGHIPGVTRP